MVFGVICGNQTNYSIKMGHVKPKVKCIYFINQFLNFISITLLSFIFLESNFWEVLIPRH